MNIIFVIKQEWLEKFGATQCVDNCENYHWIMGDDRICFFSVFYTAGDAYQTIMDVGDPKTTYAICTALIDNRHAIDAIRAAVVGDSWSGPVRITEMNWVTRQ